jgi:hypothetical protein
LPSEPVALPPFSPEQLQKMIDVTFVVCAAQLLD